MRDSSPSIDNAMHNQLSTEERNRYAVDHHLISYINLASLLRLLKQHFNAGHFGHLIIGYDNVSTWVSFLSLVSRSR